MDNILELGTDIDSKWDFDDNGDLILSSNTANLKQAIINRLNTVNGELDLYYYNYGSLIYTFFGWQRVAETLDFVKIELTECLKQDPRLNNFDLKVDYNKKGDLVIDLTIYFDEDSDLSLSFILTRFGVIDNNEDDGDGN